MKSPSELHITDPEWRIEHLSSAADCDAATAALIDVISKIDYDLASPRALSDPDWARRAAKVRSLRILAMHEVELLRASFLTTLETTWALQFVEVVKEISPHQYQVYADTVDDLINPLQNQRAA